MAATRGTNRNYEDFDPKVEWSGSDADTEVAKFSLPGFKREDIRVVVDNHGNMRIRGERLIAGNRWSRFTKDIHLPQHYNVDGIRAKFESETLTITIPKKTTSPPAGPVTTPQAPKMHAPELPRKPSAAPSQRIPPQAVPDPAATLAPAASQKLPAERRPSMTKPAPAPAPEVVEPPKSYNDGASAAATKPPQAAVTRPKEAEEERKQQMEREAAGKMAEDTSKAMVQEKDEAEEAVAAEMEAMAMVARQPRPLSASRVLLMNAAVAAVVLLGVTLYFWHTLRNATGGAGGHGHGHLGAGSYGDEM